MRKLLTLTFLVWVGYLGGYAQTAKAPPKKKVQPAAKTPTKTTATAKAPVKTTAAKPTAAKPATAKPATGTKTALPQQNKPAQSPNTGPAKTAAGPASSGGGGGDNATKLPPGSSTVTPAARSSTSNSPARSSSSYRSSPRRSSSSGYAFDQGDHLLNLGVGLGYSGYYSSAFPIGASYEYGITSDISVGAQLDIASASYYSSYYYYNYARNRYWATYVGVRGSYHFNRILSLDNDKIDLYAGIGVGYRSYSNYYDYYRPVFANGFVGGKFYFSDSFGAFVELGYTGLSYSKIGLSIKF